MEKVHTNIADKLKLNLGPFNGCVNDMSREEYPAEFYPGEVQQSVRVYYYSSENRIEFNEISKPFTFPAFNEISKTFRLPTFLVGSQSDHFNSDESRAEIVNKIELRIISMVYKMINEMDIPLQIDRIVIPIKELEIYCDEKTGTPYGWIEVGIAVWAEEIPCVAGSQGVFEGEEK